MMSEETKKIKLDLDRDRIREIVSEAVRMIHEYLGGEFTRTSEDIMKQVEGLLSTDRIATVFCINMGSLKIPTLELRVDPLKKRVLCKSAFKKKTANINHFMRILG